MVSTDPVLLVHCQSGGRVGRESAREPNAKVASGFLRHTSLFLTSDPNHSHSWTGLRENYPMKRFSHIMTMFLNELISRAPILTLIFLNI